MALFLPYVSLAEDPYFMAKTGDQALLFNLKGLELLTAGNFDGGLGYQYYFANHWAFRFGIGLDYNRHTADKPEGFEKDSVLTDFTFSLTPAIRYNVATTSNVEAYIGLFGLIGLRTINTEGINYLDTNIKTEETSFGGGLIFGAEWFAWRNVSISAEYQLLYKSTTSKQTIKIGTNEQINHLPSDVGLSLGASQANFTISFYFK